MTTLEAASDTTGSRQANFDRLLDRRLVHRRANAEVLLTDLQRLGFDDWLAGAQISRGHERVVAAGGIMPEILGVEVVRQIGIAIAHAGYEVPHEWAFTLQSAWYAWSVRPPVRVPRDAPLDLTACVTVDEVSWRRDKFDGLRLHLELLDGTGQVAAGGGSMRALAPHHYRALRRGAPDPRIAAVRCDPDPVVYDVGGEGWQAPFVAYDAADPFFFDHLTDHLPGMLLVQAMTHLWRVGNGERPLLGLELSYARFAEYEPLVRIEHVAGAGDDTFVFTQADREVARGVVTSERSQRVPLADVPSPVAARSDT